MKLNYSEGTWFCVPLRKGGFGVGVVARATSRGRVILAYLFGPRRETVPMLPEVVELVPSAAVSVIRISDLCLIRGDWPILGSFSQWQRDKWPMPNLVRSSELGRREFIIRYDDKDPARVISQERVEYGSSTLERDGSYGAGAVELELTRLLGGDAPRKDDHVAQTSELTEPDGRRPQGVQHFLYIPDRTKAEALAVRLRDEGLDVETRKGADEINWLVLVCHRFLDEDAIDRLEEHLAEYAEAIGGEYDGYERDVKQG